MDRKSLCLSASQSASRPSILSGSHSASQPIRPSFHSKVCVTAADKKCTIFCVILGGKKPSTLDPVISSSFLVFPFLVSLPLCARIRASRCTHELKMSLNIMNHREIVTLIKFLLGFKVLHAVAPPVVSRSQLQKYLIKK